MDPSMNAPASGDAGFDLSQFHGIFFQEAAENLENMEQLLLEMDIGAADDEELNAIFRCAHSVKGGAATFGFTDVAELTHQMESLLDRLRRRELDPAPAMVDVLLHAGDALRALLDAHRDGEDAGLDTSGLIARIRSLASDDGHAPRAAIPPDDPATAPGRAETAAGITAASEDPAAPGATRELELTVGPLAKPGQADDLAELFREVSDLGTIEPLDTDGGSDGMRRFRVVTPSSDEELLDLLSFHVDRKLVRLAPLDSGHDLHPAAADATASTAAADADFGFFDGAPGAPEAAVPPEASTPAPRSAAEDGAAATPVRPARQRTGTEATLRVSVDKVDQLINLVGELVITQAMLAQAGSELDSALHECLLSGLAELERNTRDLQESILSIRMIPMSVVFNRFPRMLRDLTGQLGKKVELVTEGEATELDKGMVEKIIDPLTHLVRNSCDHGIELPDERRAAGKVEHGTITLSASHQGGNVVIEVRDDGRGLDRDRLLEKARSTGIDAPDSMSDAEVWNLVFAPGFSTASEVTDVSGRGVGMDVVKKNIVALGGSVVIDSVRGCGTSVKVRLPLTLAIMESMSVGVGGECYVLPLSAVIEAFQPDADQIRTVGGGARLVKVREDYLPVVELAELMHVPRTESVCAEDSLMVIVEAESRRIALVVDELLGQQQVVVKNLEANFRRVEYVAGATIMGDGRVALILDTGGLVRRGRH